VPKYDYDLIVIGCGVSGFTAAVTAAGLGKRVLAVEKESSATGAALRSGLPSKALMRAAIAADTVRNAGKFDLAFPQPLVDTSGILPGVRTVIDSMSVFRRSEKLQRLGIKYLTGAAEFSIETISKLMERLYRQVNSSSPPAPVR